MTVFVNRSFVVLKSTGTVACWQLSSRVVELGVGEVGQRHCKGLCGDIDESPQVKFVAGLTYSFMAKLAIDKKNSTV
jgi:hypothetical protein